MKILVIEDQLFLQNAIQDLLFETRRDVHVDFIQSPHAAIELLTASHSEFVQYDFVVSDLQFENGHKSFEVIEYCTKLHIPVMAFSMFEQASIVKIALQKGACGYISKYENPADIIAGIQACMNGEHFISPRIAESLEKNQFDWSPKPLVLTSTEKMILNCLSNGLSMKQISEKYHIKDNTLRAHRRNMLQKNRCNYEQLLACFAQFPPEGL